MLICKILNNPKLNKNNFVFQKKKMNMKKVKKVVIIIKKGWI